MRKKKNTGSVHVVNFSTYTSPKIVESNRDDYVFYGENNSYFQYLIDRYTGSATNNAAINGIIQMVFGRGLDATNSSKKPEDYAKMKTLLNDDVTFKFCNDLKLLGQCAIQVVYNNKHTKIIEVEHLPVETLVAEKLEDGDEQIQAYYYHPDWENKKQNEQPTRIPSFGTSKESVEILYLKPYKSGYYYYSPVDYQGGLQYAELEEEVSNYHLSNIMNGLAPSMLINMNNGSATEEERKKVERDIYNKYSGSSNAGRFILAFNDDKDNAATIEAVQLSDAHNQYQFLSDESMRKIMVSHRIVSPMLLGIKDSSGLGNNADELKQASVLMDNTVIRPFQDILIKGFNEILHFNDIVLNLYFKTLQPLEFIDLNGNDVDKETTEEETGVKMSAEVDLDNFGEDEDLDNWELIDERKVDYESEDDLDEEINNLNNPKQSVLSKIWNFATTGTARPNAKSEQDRDGKDGVKFKVRYQYAPLKTSSNSREFCDKMVAAKKIYRKEDIEQMGKHAVNAGWGLEGANTYDIWLYKGGGDCHHYWMRKTYMQKGNIKPDLKSPRVNDVSVNEAKKNGLKPIKNDKKVAMRPTDMPNNGFVNK